MKKLHGKKIWCFPRPQLIAAKAAGIAIITMLTWSIAMAAPSVTVTNARIRLLPGDLPLAGYFDLVNHGKQPLTLLAATSPVFKMINMHLSMEKNKKSTMVNVDDIEMNPGQELHFSPGGYHLMLMQRVKPLRIGDKIPITLQFSNNQSLETMFEIMGAATR
ncbi:MAG: copper chaperone PCu(A)C [Sulfuricaulis sp.]